jgi:hypothetical protein
MRRKTVLVAALAAGLAGAAVLALVRQDLTARSCRWWAVAIAWVDRNANGVRDPGEPVVENAALVAGQRWGRSLAWAETDDSGVAYLNSWGSDDCGPIRARVRPERRTGLTTGVPVAVPDDTVRLGFRSAPPEPPPSGIRDTGSARIRMARGMCFGTCPVYSVEVDGSGLVRYEGLMHVADTGLREGRISREEFAALLRAFDRAGFHLLADVYGADTCYDITDQPDVLLAL